MGSKLRRNRDRYVTKLKLYLFSASVTLKLDRLGLTGFFSQRNSTLLLDGMFVCARAISGRPPPSDNPAPTRLDAKNIRRDETPSFANVASDNMSLLMLFSLASSLEEEDCSDDNDGDCNDL